MIVSFCRFLLTARYEANGAALDVKPVSYFTCLIPEDMEWYLILLATSAAEWIYVKLLDIGFSAKLMNSEQIGSKKIQSDIIAVV